MLGDLLRSSSIRTRLLVIALLPAAAVTWLSAERSLARVAELRGAADLSRSVRAAVALGDLLHETQRERGLTSLHLSSGRARYGAELDAQRPRTDQRIAALQGLLQDPAGAPPGLAEVAGRTVEVTRLRRRAAEPDAPARELIAGYTTFNQGLLAAIGVMTPTVADASMARQLEAYQALLAAKERTGLLRAQLANAFSTDRFAPGQLVTVASLIARRDTYLEAFLAAATDDVRAFASAAQQDPAFAAVRDLEKRALEREGGGFGVDPGEWFKTISRTIDRLKEVEVRQAALLESRAASAGATARGALLLWLALGTLLLATTALATTLVVRSITRPLAEVARAAASIAEGHLEGAQVDYRGDNEVGALADSFRALSAYVEEATGVVEALAAGDLTRGFHSRGDGDVLGTALARMIDNLRALVEELQATGGRLGHSSEGMATISRDLDRRAAQTLEEVNHVAAASTQLQGCIAEIARNAARAAQLAVQAAEEARASGGTIDRLAASSAGIGTSLGFISTIGEQTNTLALNATIEAARAGAAGKGFAVVATEVKELARKSLGAAAEIARAVQTMKADSDGSIAAIGHVGARIEEVNTAATSIAASVEEQAITARQIGESMRSTLEGATATREAASQASGTARDLASMADQVAELVRRFQLEGQALPAAPSTSRPRLSA